MTKQKEIYKCNVCGNIVEVLHIGVGQLVCCGQPMELMKSLVEDVGTEKHLPVTSKIKENLIEVRVGEENHPMIKDHWIEWIEINTKNNESFKKFLEPENEPKALFETNSDTISARCYCNIHGLWEKKV